MNLWVQSLFIILFSAFLFQPAGAQPVPPAQPEATLSAVSAPVALTVSAVQKQKMQADGSQGKADFDLPEVIIERENVNKFLLDELVSWQPDISERLQIEEQSFDESIVRDFLKMPEIAQQLLPPRRAGCLSAWGGYPAAARFGACISESRHGYSYDIAGAYHGNKVNSLADASTTWHLDSTLTTRTGVLVSGDFEHVQDRLARQNLLALQGVLYLRADANWLHEIKARHWGYFVPGSTDLRSGIGYQGWYEYQDARYWHTALDITSDFNQIYVLTGQGTHQWELDSGLQLELGVVPYLASYHGTLHASLRELLRMSWLLTARSRIFAHAQGGFQERDEKLTLYHFSQYASRTEPLATRYKLYAGIEYKSFYNDWYARFGAGAASITNADYMDRHDSGFQTRAREMTREWLDVSGRWRWEALRVSATARYQMINPQPYLAPTVDVAGTLLYQLTEQWHLGCDARAWSGIRSVAGETSAYILTPYFKYIVDESWWIGVMLEDALDSGFSYGPDREISARRVFAGAGLRF